MRAKGVVIALLAIGLGGCANKAWDKYGATQQDFYRDKSECSAMSGSGGNYQIQPGYRSSSDPFGAGFQQGWNNASAIGAVMSSGRIFEECMMGRGWSLVPEGQRRPAVTAQAGSQWQPAAKQAEPVKQEPLSRFGPSKLSAAQYAPEAPAAAAPKVDPKIEQAVAQLMGDPFEEAAATPEERFWRSLARQVPNYRQINDDLRFHQWLSVIDSTTGKERQQLLIEAQQRNDADTVAAMFNQFLKTL